MSAAVKAATDDEAFLRREAETARRDLTPAVRELCIALSENTIPTSELEPLVREVLSRGGYLVAVSRLLK